MLILVDFVVTFVLIIPIRRDTQFSSFVTTCNLFLSKYNFKQIFKIAFVIAYMLDSGWRYCCNCDQGIFAIFFEKSYFYNLSKNDNNFVNILSIWIFMKNLKFEIRFSGVIQNRSRELEKIILIIREKY